MDTGNPHFDQTIEALDMAAKLVPASAEVAYLAIQTQATLALAYEQRTANLLALFNSLQDGETETFLGERIDGYDLARSIKARLAKVKAEAGQVVVPAPFLSTKAVGSKDSHYLRTAARNIQQGYNVGGSGVTNMVATLLADTAAAMEAEGN